MVLRKDEGLIIPVSVSQKGTLDMRDSYSASWRDVVYAVLEDAGRPMKLNELYEAIDGHKKTEANKNWQAKIRQTLQINGNFKRVSEGVWAITA